MLGNSVVVSLFDESGNMVRDWARAGYICYCYDLLNMDRIESVGDGMIIYRAADLTKTTTHTQIMSLHPAIIFGFPPCTDLAVCGSRAFSAKRKKDKNFQKKAVALARVVEKIGNAAGCPWMAENPVSVLATLWRKPDFTFHPWEYGSYLPSDDEHPRWPDYIASRDAYSKKTCLWTGGGFRMPKKRPVKVKDGYSNQYKKLGGKSAKTKQIRSETPRGFARAVFEEYN